jgi:hypothetical protein
MNAEGKWELINSARRFTGVISLSSMLVVPEGNQVLQR